MEIPKQQKESAMDCLATKMKNESVCWVVFYYLKIFHDIKKKKSKGGGKNLIFCRLPRLRKNLEWSFVVSFVLSCHTSSERKSEKDHFNSLWYV